MADLPNTRIIPLTQGFSTIIDADDYDRLASIKWHATISKSGKPYAAAATRTADGRKTTFLMHRVIINAPAGLFVDHRSLDTLDNRKMNLRTCGYSGNNRNRAKFMGKSSRFKGVSFVPKKNKWHVVIIVDSKKLFLGEFRDEIEAAKAYDAAAVKHHGEFAYLNFR